MRKLEAVLWSIAFPGFSQLLQGNYVKGLLFILMELMINVFGHFNEAIFLSFIGEITRSMEVINIQWMLFYPCLYFFAMYDAYRNAEGEQDEGAYLPFCFSAFCVTLGFIYSYRVSPVRHLPGPIFLPILAVIPGLMIGAFLKRWFYPK